VQRCDRPHSEQQGDDGCQRKRDLRTDRMRRIVYFDSGGVLDSVAFVPLACFVWWAFGFGTIA
jgi:hypothetical protein